MYSIWILPSSDVGESINRMLSHLSFARRQKALTPHVTLIGDLVGDASGLQGKASEVASLLRPFSIVISNLVMTSECAVLTVAMTDLLTTARNLATNVLSQQQDEVYRPHITLTYDGPTKENSSVLQRQFAIMPRTFLADTIHFVRTPPNTPPNDWHISNSFKMRLHDAHNEGG
jgi:2'-5' RNA ligase